MNFNDMKLFSWSITVDGYYTADGFILARNREEAEYKLKLLPCRDKYINEIITIDSDDCGYYGCEIDKYGIIVRKEFSEDDEQ